ncbi:hypothetical protein ACRRTK_005708 [Alexandromys fortis]
MTISNLQKQEFTTLAHSSRGKACNVKEGVAWNRKITVYNFIYSPKAERES